jgi:hypothetical protein
MTKTESMALSDKKKASKLHKKSTMKKESLLLKQQALKKSSLIKQAKKTTTSKTIKPLREKNRKSLEKKLDTIFSIYIRLRDRVK